MANKCSNCGFEYGEFDIYCSRCGHKIDPEHDITMTAQEVYDNNMNNVDAADKQLQGKLEFFYKRKEYEGNILDAFVIMFLICIVLTVLICAISARQTTKRAYLNYKSMISKPAQIPLLKNTESLDELSINLSNCEYFLMLYLRFSNDDSEKKEQIFSNYLTELSKLENITNENIFLKDHPECELVKSPGVAKRCTIYFKKQLKNTGAFPYLYNGKIYLYPNKKYVYKKYSKLVSPDMKNLLKLEAKYSKPTSFDGALYEKPIYLSNKISKFEKFYNNESNQKIKTVIEQELYDDVKDLLFARNIYDTTTHEMQQGFKRAFNTYLLKNKYSSLKALFLSYLDKQRNFTQDNFTKDYPYKLYEDSFDENVQNSTFKDIFAQLRKNLATNVNSSEFAYIYNLMDSKWIRYKQGYELNSHNYIISYPDENNNVTFYNFAYTPVQELNIGENTNLFINGGQIYIYNYDKLAIYKITFNGKTFNTKNLNFTDITAIFPGVNIINIDSTNNYDIYVEKANKNANFIILSRYAQGLKNYELTSLKGEIKQMTLSNMFSVNSNEDMIISFHEKNLDMQETSEQYPTYKIHISTIGHPKSNIETQDTETVNNTKVEQSDDSETEEPHTPTIKPKINTDENDALVLPPAKNLEPPSDDE